MCGGGGYSSGDAANDRGRAKAEAEAQRIAADQEAQATANAASAAARVRKRANSLTMARTGGGATPATSSALTSTVLARGANTLGGS